MAACLPEQFIATGSGPPPARSQSRRATSSSGRSGGVCKAATVSPAEASTRRTPSRWNGSPECEAPASASSSSSSG